MVASKQVSFVCGGGSSPYLAKLVDAGFPRGLVVTVTMPTIRDQLHAVDRKYQVRVGRSINDGFRHAPVPVKDECRTTPVCDTFVPGPTFGTTGSNEACGKTKHGKFCVRVTCTRDLRSCSRFLYLKPSHVDLATLSGRVVVVKFPLHQLNASTQCFHQESSIQPSTYAC